MQDDIIMIDVWLIIAV